MDYRKLVLALIFFINVPIGLISILMIMIVIVDPPYMQRTRMKIDYWGMLFLAVSLGCLQIILDKGHREDWFSSSFIIWMSYVSIASFVMLVLVESFQKNPIVDLRVFKNLSFTSGNVILFFAVFNLFGSIVLLPIYLQTLMGYTSFLAGLALGPGGIASIFSMALAGRLVAKISPKAVLPFGVVLAGYATHMMAQFNLYADFNTIFWPRAVLGFGMGLIFIPLMTMTMSGLRKEEMGNAAAIFNLLRNLGGSFGVAFATTMIARRAQFHQVHLVEYFTPFDRNFQATLPHISQLLEGHGLISSLATQGGLSLIYQQLLRQAAMMSFNDAFHILSVMTMLVLPLVILTKKGTEDTSEQVVH